MRNRAALVETIHSAARIALPERQCLLLQEALNTAKWSRRPNFGHEKISPVILRPKLLFPILLISCVGLVCTFARASSNPDADAQAGAVLFRDKGCAHCHGTDLAGTPKGPSLVDISKDKAWPPEKMTDHILDGGQKMPPFRESLDDNEIAQLVAYLRAKNRPVPPPLANGQVAPPAPAPKN